MITFIPHIRDDSGVKLKCDRCKRFIPYYRDVSYGSEQCEVNSMLVPYLGMFQDMTVLFTKVVCFPLY